MEGKIGDTGRLSGGVGSDRGRNWNALVIGKTKTDEVLNMENSRIEHIAHRSRFQNSVVRATGSVAESSNQLS
jgi:hypothetical protein